MQIRERKNTVSPQYRLAGEPFLFVNVRRHTLQALKSRLPRFLRYPAAAASIAATSIFCVPIIAVNTLRATTGSGSCSASVSTRGVIGQDRPHLFLHQSHSLATF